MKNLSTWLLACFMIMFWLFRLVVAFTTSLGIDIGFAPLNMNIEIVLLFVTLVAVVLVVKRKLLGAIIYLVSYGAYFGVDLFNRVMAMVNNTAVFNDYTSMFVSFIAMIIPIAVLFDILVDKQRKLHPVDKKTDWFYKNEEYDRKLDDRADKNNYRTL